MPHPNLQPSRPINEQSAPLKQLLYALLGDAPVEPKRLSELADDYFAAAFARGNAKPSLVNNRDFAFLEMFVTGDLVDSDDKPHLTLLCPGHSHLLRLQPIDDNYDVVLEILQNSLKQLDVPQDTATALLAFVASQAATACLAEAALSKTMVRHQLNFVRMVNLSANVLNRFHRCC